MNKTDKKEPTEAEEFDQVEFEISLEALIWTLIFILILSVLPIMEEFLTF